jgi:hypothetical protein
MIKYGLLATAMVAMTLAPALASAADKPDWSLCAPEIAKFKCTDAQAKGDEELYNCLIKHDGEFSKVCDPETTKYEVLTGKPQ